MNYVDDPRAHHGRSELRLNITSSWELFYGGKAYCNFDQGQLLSGISLAVRNPVTNYFLAAANANKRFVLHRRTA